MAIQEGFFMCISLEDTLQHPFEQQRLAALASYQLFGTAPEKTFDEIVALAAQICNAKIGLISLVGEQTIWFKAQYGIDAQTMAREGAFCSQAILHDEVLVIEDASHDHRFAQTVEINDEQVVRFYAGAPLITTSGLPIGVICALDDQPKQMTELQILTLKVLANQVMAQMELHKSLRQMRIHSDKMRTSNQNKDKFFSIIAHDLRAAFHGILGFSEVLDTELDDLDPDAIRKIASYLNHSSQSTFKLLENLLEWAMLENGSMRFRPEFLLLESIIDTVATGLDLSAKQKNIQLDFRIDSGIVVHADLHMLQSLVHNLISNALKFTPQGGHISITQDQVDTMVHVYVKDDGVGMNQEQSARLFRPELSQSTKGTMGEVGTGLGLLLCKQFVEQHGGRIQAHSALGEGSVFSFSLPILASAAL
jgi:signal transduction histidine kinase